MAFFLINGVLQQDTSAAIFADDQGWTLGNGVFETIRLENGKCFLMEAHLKRLENALNLLEIGTQDWRENLLKSLPKDLSQLTKYNNLALARARITISPGRQAPGLSHNPNISPTCLIQTFPLKHISHFQPISACLAPWPKNSLSPLSQIKSTSYAEILFAQRYAQKLNCSDVLFTSIDGFISEFGSANIFWIDQKNTLHTPPLSSGCLPGIMREHILLCAQKLSIPTTLSLISPEQLLEAKAIAATSAIRGIICLEKFYFSERKIIHFPARNTIFQELQTLCFKPISNSLF